MTDEARARTLARRHCYGISFTPDPGGKIQRLIEDAYVAGFLRSMRERHDDRS
jgi:hypothetical protein